MPFSKSMPVFVSAKIIYNMIDDETPDRNLIGSKFSSSELFSPSTHSIDKPNPTANNNNSDQSKAISLCDDRNLFKVN